MANDCTSRLLDKDYVTDNTNHGSGFSFEGLESVILELKERVNGKQKRFVASEYIEVTEPSEGRL